MESSHRVWLAGACALSSALLACDVFDTKLLEHRSEPITGDGDDCSSTDEVCDGEDNDCDGRVDEGADRMCGFENAVAVCAAGGRCVFQTCLSGYVNCNNDVEDGCELLLREAECGRCGVICDDAGEPIGTIDAGEDSGTSSMPDADMPIDEDEDASAIDPPPQCIEEAEVCDSEDNDCDEKVDEGNACGMQECLAMTPSSRGAECDACVCEKCGALLDLCQRNPDTTWAAQCDDVVECVATNDLAGNCGTNHDCYSGGTRPCVAPLNIAAGGTSPTDNTHVVAGCVAGTPPTTACMAAINYRDQCTTTTCMDECDGI